MRPHIPIVRFLLKLGSRSKWVARGTSFLLQWLLVSIGTLLTYLLMDSTVRTGPDSIGRIAFFALFSLSALIIARAVAAGANLIFPGLEERAFGSTFLNPKLAEETRSLNQIIEERAQLSSKDLPLLDRLTVTQEIDKRVTGLKIRSTALLFAIALALMAAAIVVLFAGRLTSLDAEAVSNVDRAKSETAEATGKLNRLIKYQSLYQQFEKASAEASKFSNDSADKKTADSKVAEVKKEIDRMEFGYNSAANPGPVDIETARSAVDAQRKEVDALAQLVDEIRKKELLADRGYGDWRYIVATAITRVGVVLIIVFLVQILMGLYRYNAKLIAYYSSRRDLFTLWDGKLTMLHPLDKSLTLPPIDFGKEPKHPLEDIIRSLGSQKVDGSGVRLAEKK